MDTAVVRPDRRRLRAERSTEAVIDAMLDLYREGVLRPGAGEIAARAGVSERTVYRLFDDLEALAAATIERQTQRVRHLFAPPDKSGNREARIAALVAQRMRLYEEIAPVMRAGQLRSPFSPVVRAEFARRADLLRRQVERQFRGELLALPEGERFELLTALDVSSSMETLELLCQMQNHPSMVAGAVITRTLRALLATTDRVQPSGAQP